MVVVSADDDDFRLPHRIGALHQADDVPDWTPHLLGPLHDGHCEVVQRPRTRVEIAVDLVGHCLEIEVRSKGALNEIARQEDDRQSVVLGLRIAQPPAVAVGRRPVVGVVDDQQRLGAARPRDLDLSDERGMRRVGLPFKGAARVVLLRFVREDQNGFSGRVDASVVVIRHSRRRDAVAGKDHRKGSFRRRRVGCRRPQLIVASDFEGDAISRGVQRDQIARMHRQPGDHVEALEEGAGVPERLEPGGGEFLGDIVGRRFESGRSVATTLELVRRQESHVLDVRTRGDLARLPR